MKREEEHSGNFQDDYNDGGREGRCGANKRSKEEGTGCVVIEVGSAGHEGLCRLGLKSEFYSRSDETFLHIHTTPWTDLKREVRSDLCSQ